MDNLEPLASVYPLLVMFYQAFMQMALSGSRVKCDICMEYGHLYTNILTLKEALLGHLSPTATTECSFSIFSFRIWQNLEVTDIKRVWQFLQKTFLKYTGKDSWGDACSVKQTQEASSIGFCHDAISVTGRGIMFCSWVFFGCSSELGSSLWCPLTSACPLISCTGPSGSTRESQLSMEQAVWTLLHPDVCGHFIQLLQQYS
jgi:hypothetical protein